MLVVAGEASLHVQAVDLLDAPADGLGDKSGGNRGAGHDLNVDAERSPVLDHAGLEALLVDVLAASRPVVLFGTPATARTDCESSTTKLGSAARPAFSRTIIRSASLILGSVGRSAPSRSRSGRVISGLGRSGV
ncbi:hypothetical protein [Streptomyces sp. NPDC002172]